MVDLQIDVAGLKFKNPVWAGSCEITMSPTGIRACIDAGAGAVVAKSINESPDAAAQLDLADYVVLDEDGAPIPWQNARETTGGSFFCRSGLTQSGLDEWLTLLADADEYAHQRGSYVIGSVTVAAPEPAAEIVERMSDAVRCIEVNLSAIHSREARAGAILLSNDPADVGRITALVRAHTDLPLLIKLTGQTVDVPALARAAVDNGADAVTMIGRAPAFVPDLETLQPVLGSRGAIGGRWALPTAMYWVATTRAALGGNVPIVGTNGARTGGDVLRFMLSGASAVEVATILFTHGPAVLDQLVESLTRHVEAAGSEAVAELIGRVADRASDYAQIRHAPGPTDDRWPWSDLLQDAP